LPIIRDILGHVDITTTGIYAKASLKKKREALEKVNLSPQTSQAAPVWRTDKDLLEFLQAL